MLMLQMPFLLYYILFSTKKCHRNMHGKARTEIPPKKSLHQMP